MHEESALHGSTIDAPPAPRAIMTRTSGSALALRRRFLWYSGDTVAPHPERCTSRRSSLRLVVIAVAAVVPAFAAARTATARLPGEDARPLPVSQAARARGGIR